MSSMPLNQNLNIIWTDTVEERVVGSTVLVKLGIFLLGENLKKKEFIILILRQGTSIGLIWTNW